jgi:hypothetical protein
MRVLAEGLLDKCPQTSEAMVERKQKEDHWKRLPLAHKELEQTCTKQEASGETGRSNARNWGQTARHSYGCFELMDTFR